MMAAMAGGRVGVEVSIDSNRLTRPTELSTAQFSCEWQSGALAFPMQMPAFNQLIEEPLGSHCQVATIGTDFGGPDERATLGSPTPMPGGENRKATRNFCFTSYGRGLQRADRACFWKCLRQQQDQTTKTHIAFLRQSTNSNLSNIGLVWSPLSRKQTHNPKLQREEINPGFGWGATPS